MLRAEGRDALRPNEGCSRSGFISREEGLRRSPGIIIDEDAVVVECGGSLKEVLGLGEDEVLGRDWFDIFMNDEGEAIQSRVGALKAELAKLESHCAFTFVADYNNKSFQWSGFVFASIGAGSSDNGKCRRVVLIAQDVTGCRESVWQLERYMVELEQMNRAQSSRELRMGEMRRKIYELEQSLVYGKGRGQV